VDWILLALDSFLVWSVVKTVMKFQVL
jgi:hypothetical protein